jgi:cell migration-inducing and hyaluronan-binding protein
MGGAMNSRASNARRCNPRPGTSSVRLCRGLLVAVLLVLGAQAAQAAADVICPVYGDGDLPTQARTDDPPDLKVTGDCNVRLGADRKYFYKNVNIVRDGELRFRESTYSGPNGPQDSKTDFWASSIIIENGGSMIADGGPFMPGSMLPFGYYGGVLTIHLYGRNEAEWDSTTNTFKKQNLGTLCKSADTDRDGNALGPCGIPKAKWDTNGASEVDLPGYDSNSRPVRDFFYQYGPLYGDAQCTDDAVFENGSCKKEKDQKPAPAAKVGYFGNKVLAVSYGATLDLAGYKGATYDGYWDRVPDNSGTSWMRLADGNSLKKGDTSLVLERYAGWKANDEIVVTTTDYLPGHSEKLQIKPDYVSGATIPFQVVVGKDDKDRTTIQWSHNGTRYGGPADDSKKQWTTRLEERVRKSLDPDLVKSGAETRAAVALLTRSIQIVSAGDKAGEDFKAEDTHYSYGAHMVVRQGFKELRIQGVEFKQMGQGGRLAHYPVHFHMARKTPADTYIKDSSINESMTRWIVLHSTQGVTLARNVGYKSIGHGYYLEDGTETDNNLYSNIGIFARAAVDNVDLDSKQNAPNPQNPRMIPGILADNTDPLSFNSPDVANSGFIYRSDVENPTVFWITNGWNNFIGNMAAGAGTCGAAYWFVPAANSDMIETAATHEHMKWSGYAGLQMPGMDENKQLTPGLAGATPLKSFFKNYATSTMHSFQTTPDAPACNGVIAANAQPGKLPVLRAVPSLAPAPARHKVPFSRPNKHEEADTLNDHYYPHLVGLRFPVRCTPTGDGYDCGKVKQVCSHPPAENCALTVLDHFTSSFHWAHGNVSAIWLRPQWYLLTNSVVSDVQNGGVTFITGGDYTHSSVIDGYWGLAKSSVFIGNTQDNAKSPYAGNTGPFNALTKLKCDTGIDAVNDLPDYCINANETISMPTSGFFTNQRLANIYDGPSYQDSNAYLDIKTADCAQGEINSGCMYGTKLSYLRLKTEPGISNSTCYLPNAAIAWKQPNGFFYPPAFHVTNLFFDNVDLRHYVIDPLFKSPDGVTNFGQGGTYLTDPVAVENQLCVEKARYPDLFNSFTSIDRQTELNDDDGSLTGLSNSLPKADPLNQTISINEDAFFSAPRETAECGSAKGDNADAKNACDAKFPLANKPPVTARTSPYDYVATILYHQQAPADRDPDDVWGVDCAHQDCYGVPLYRQYMTKAEQTRWTAYKCSDQAKPPLKPKPECRWPFIRMSGEALSQRETLTINNGMYYVDTTVRRNTQENEDYTNTVKGAARSRNVFKDGQTYYMFFAYAKTSTVQTYQIYVGQDFDIATGFKTGRMNIDGFDFLAKSTESWAMPVKGGDGDGILTVNIDFTGWTALDPSPDSGLCQPRSFCTTAADPKDSKKKICVSKQLTPEDPLVAANRSFVAQNANICESWAMKDLDCPPVVKKNGVWTDGGCFAFAFTLPAKKFTADDTYRRPEPKLFPTALDPKKKQGAPDWTTKFTPGVKAPDACFYPKVPGTDCPVPRFTELR